jgi:acyl-lipid omega-6 desaturase (Delta-12 desaturase)
LDQSTPTNQLDLVKQNWREVVARYQQPDIWRSYWEIANSILPYFFLLYLMFRSLEISYWLTLALSLPTAGFLMRIFIIFHDCGHGSFFKSKRLNAFWGFVTGVITYTPYHYWTRDHAIHHATVSDLDRRGIGDVKTMTVKEYLALSTWGKLEYRLYRNPLIMFVLGPAVVFLVIHRFARKDAGKRERYSVYWTNFALLVAYLVLIPAIGLQTYLLVHLPVLLVGFSAGVWLFYVQHQFEGTYWEHHKDWDFVTAAIKGSSFYKLPKILQWFTGNIGFHHIHHLSPRIPNYLLEKCHNENPMFQDIEPVTLLSSLKCLKFRLWDDERLILVGYDALKNQAEARVANRLKP